MGELQQLFKDWSIINGFPIAENICRELLRSHLSLGAVTANQQVENSTPPALSVKPNEIRLNHALFKLYENQQDYDVEIMIEQNITATGHAFVLMRCPLFREFLSNKKSLECKPMRMQFAAPEWLLYALMEICYLGQLSAALRASLTGSDALIIADLIDSFFGDAVDLFGSIAKEVQFKIDQQRRIQEERELLLLQSGSKQKLSSGNKKCTVS
jgi:hypothetical protein